VNVYPGGQVVETELVSTLILIELTAREDEEALPTLMDTKISVLPEDPTPKVVPFGSIIFQ
jgi:hypothetical protein